MLRPLMSEAKQDDLYSTGGYRIIANANAFTLFCDESRFRMHNLPISVWRFIKIWRVHLHMFENK